MTSAVFGGKYGNLIKALIVSNAVSFGLFFIRVLGAESFRFWFLFWNLALAWVPLLFAYLLKQGLRERPWTSWQNLTLTALWLGFLPNSFYIVSDLIHVHLTGEINILFDVVLMFSCIFNGYVFGYMSVYLVHKELLKRIPTRDAHAIIGMVFLLCGFAIYLGRYLRWNTWDILLHPIGLLFDISDRFLNPAAHPQTFGTTLTFFALIASMYYVIWEFVNVLRKQKN
jgi:uncharacterized membrane protein